MTLPSKRDRIANQRWSAISSIALGSAPRASRTANKRCTTCTTAAGDQAQQATLVRIATNSIHYHWVPDPPPARTSKVQQLSCGAPCNTHLSIDHLAVCPQAPAQAFRNKLQTAIIGHLSDDDKARVALSHWSRWHPGADLHDLLTYLFPPPPPPPLLPPLPPLTGPLVATAAAPAAAGDLAAHQLRHRTLCMLGAFTDDEASNICRTLQFQPEGSSHHARPPPALPREPRSILHSSHNDLRLSGHVVHSDR